MNFKKSGFWVIEYNIQNQCLMICSLDLLAFGADMYRVRLGY